MASGQVNRTQRPNTWLLRPALRRDQSLDNPEPFSNRTSGPSLPFIATHLIVSNCGETGRAAHVR